MINYIKYTDQELLNILSKHGSLTFLAKTGLKKELLRRDIVKESKKMIELEK